MNRKTLDFSSLPQIMASMTESSALAAKIIDELIETKGETNSLGTLIILDDMNIRGIQLGQLYEKLCQNDIDMFYEKVLTMTKEDIEKLNYLSSSLTKYKAKLKGSAIDRSNNPSKYLFTEEERKKINDEKNNQKKSLDLYPTIKSDEALKIIDENGFKLGYEQKYEMNHQSVIYRMFYNEIGDIIYVHSLEKPDIFLYGESKLNVVRQNKNKDLENIECNIYTNVLDTIGYNIELREKPFETYKKIIEKNQKTLTEIKAQHYNSNLIPIPETINGIKYKNEKKTYTAIVIKEIYNLLNFPETYAKLDDGLKKIYKPLIAYSKDKAYDELIYQLNNDGGIEIGKELNKIFNLDREKIVLAKNRYVKRNNKHFNIPKPRFFSRFIVEDPKDKEINERINKVLPKENIYIK